MISIAVAHNGTIKPIAYYFRTNTLKEYKFNNKGRRTERHPALMFQMRYSNDGVIQRVVENIEVTGKEY